MPGLFRSEVQNLTSPAPTAPTPTTPLDSYRSVLGNERNTVADLNGVVVPADYPLYMDILEKQLNDPFTRPEDVYTNVFMRPNQTG
jgi:hypothetical protein